MTKVVILGDTGVGKTSLIQVKEKGSMGDQLATIQPTEVHFTQIVNDTSVEVAIWDTPGQYNFRNMVKNFLRDSVGIVFVFDITNLESFSNLDEWYSFVTEAIHPQFFVLVQNKTDLEDERDVSEREAQEWANNHHMTIIRTSAKSSKGVSDLFELIASEVYKHGQTSVSSEIKLKEEDASSKKKKKCCK